MAFRTIVISTHSKLEYSLNYLVYKTIDSTIKINLDEIHTIIIESTAVSITTALILELIKKNIKIIFCDEKRNPSSEVLPYYGNSINAKRIQEQINWSNDTKDEIWRLIIKEKIKNQAKVLEIINADLSKALYQFSEEVQTGDISNREGHAAKVYFNNLFGKNFTRGNSDEKNIFLNYGYSILLSQFNKSIVSKGYITQIGIHHKNVFNEFNLGCDLMEPFRPIVDKLALNLNMSNYKDELINMLNLDVIIDNQKQSLFNAINIYTSSVFKCLSEGSLTDIKFIEKYEF